MSTYPARRNSESRRNSAILTLPINKRSHARLVGRVERAHFNYFVANQNQETGLVLDRSTATSPASIAAVGFSLAAHACAVRRGWLSREKALDYCLKTLRTLWSAPQGDAEEGTSGFHGYFYHFLEPDTGLRATAPRFWNSELSSIDTALLMAGVRFAGNYFQGKSDKEVELQDLAKKLYERVEWNWLFRDGSLVGHGWSPEGGFIPHSYQGYSEALLLYILALGSPTHPAPNGAWQAYLANASLKSAYGQTYINMPGEPLFCYQYPHCFVDFRGIRDEYNERFGFDWFENSRRMALVHYQYAQANPLKFRGYGGLNWGLTACDGPGDVTKVVDGVQRVFRGYSERGCPDGIDDGTLAPTAALSSIAYVPEIVIPTMRYWLINRPELFSDHGGFCDAFNPTFDVSSPTGWVDAERIGIDQGPIVLMFENWRSGLIWSVMRRDPYVKAGLVKAGFHGGWLKK